MFTPCITLAIFFIALFVCEVPASLAIGNSPSTILQNDMLSGTRIEREMTIYGSDVEGEERIQITLDDPAAAYVSLPLGDIFTFTPSLREITFPVIIEPRNLAEGEYQATMRVIQSPLEEEEINVTGQRILVGSTIPILFSVTNEQKELLKLSYVRLVETEEGQSVGFVYAVDNQGNVDSRPSRIDFKMKHYSDKSDAYAQVIEGSQLEITPAFTKKESTVSVDVRPEQGLYYIDLVFYNRNNQVIGQEEDMLFQVHPEGSLAKKGENVSFSLDRRELFAGEQILMSGSFLNTGEAGLEVNMVTQIMKKDALVEFVRSEPKFVEDGKEVSFQEAYQPSESGDYIVRAFFEYGPNTTEEIQDSFTVKAIRPIYIVIGLILIGALLAGAFILMGRYLVKKSSTEPIDNSYI